MAITIKEVVYGGEEYRALLKLRYEVLRKPRNIELSDKDTATDNKKFHLAAFEYERPIGCVLLEPISPDILWLHQMAVSAAHQGQGIGAELVRRAEKLSASHGFKTIEMHANRSAQGFYKKLGYVAEREEFIENAVQAVKMLKHVGAVSKGMI